jgi:hypothetical protein
MLEKYCRDCGHKRPVADFSANRRSRDGLAFYCRDHLAERAARSRESRRTEQVRYRSRPRYISVPAGSKWCPDCGQVKLDSEFARSRASASGVASYCLPCHNQRGKRSIAKRGGSRTYHLTRRYGITAEEADTMLEEQGGVCAICRAAPAQHVDHDHETDAVRALLCFNCNGGLGQFKDDPNLLHVAAFYVEHHRERQTLTALQESAGGASELASRPDEPPVGSRRRPGRAGSTRATGRTSGSRRRDAGGDVVP